MSRADYLAALHAAFDARRDPLDEPAVRAWLTAHPEDLAEFAAMRAALAAPSEPRAWPEPVFAPTRRTLWPMALPPLAAAAALLLFLRADRERSFSDQSTPARGVLAADFIATVTPAQQPLAPSNGAAVLATSATFTRTAAFKCSQF